MELVNQTNKVVYKGTKEELYEVYELCHQLELKVPNFYCRVVETDEWCYLEILFEKIGEYYSVGKKETSERVKDYCNSYWQVEE